MGLRMIWELICHLEDKQITEQTSQKNLAFVFLLRIFLVIIPVPSDSMSFLVSWPPLTGGFRVIAWTLLVPSSPPSDKISQKSQNHICPSKFKGVADVTCACWWLVHLPLLPMLTAGSTHCLQRDFDWGGFWHHSGQYGGFTVSSLGRTTLCPSSRHDVAKKGSLFPYHVCPSM